MNSSERFRIVVDGRFAEFKVRLSVMSAEIRSLTKAVEQLAKEVKEVRSKR